MPKLVLRILELMPIMVDVFSKSMCLFSWGNNKPLGQVRWTQQWAWMLFLQFIYLFRRECHARGRLVSEIASKSQLRNWQPNHQLSLLFVNAWGKMSSQAENAIWFFIMTLSLCAVCADAALTRFCGWQLLPKFLHWKCLRYVAFALVHPLLNLCNVSPH